MMTSHRVRQHLLALTLPAGYLLTPMTASAQATWNGGTSAAWNTAANWSTTPNVPVDPFALTIANSTVNGLTLDTNHTVTSVTIGSVEPLRISAFTFQTNAANTLTINGGITANGAFAGVGPTFRGNYNFSQAQTVTVAGAAGDVTTDRGVAIRGVNETAGTVASGTVTLNGNLSKAGVGQLSFINTNVTGSGNLIADAGTLKLNAGGNQPLVIGGTGNITVNGTASLLFSRNSGTFDISRPILVNGTSSLVFGGGGDGSTIASAFTFSNDSHALTVSRNFTLSGAITGSPIITRTGGSILTLSGSTSGFTGSFANNAGNLNISNAFGGNLSVGGGAVVVSNTIAGNVSASAGSLAVSGLVGGTAGTSGTGSLTLGAGVTGNVFGSAGTMNLSGPLGSDLTVSGVALNSESTVVGSVSITNGSLGIQPSTAANLHANLDVVMSGTTTVNLLGAVPLATPFKVLSYDGVLIGDETNFTLTGGAAAYRGFTFTNNIAAKSVDLSVTAGAVTWNGLFSANWDINTTANWSGTSDKFFQQDAVTFPSVASNKLINITATVAPASITFDNSAGNDYSFSGTGVGFISGGASITKNNTGSVQLGGANGQNFTGPIAVNGGILRMGSRDAFGTSSGITVASGAQVDINGQLPGGVATGGYTYTIAGTGPAPANLGALVNTGAASNENAGVKNLILSADATIGGSGRIDLGNAGTAGFGTITGNSHTLTVTNTGGVGFRGDANATPISIVANGATIWAENTDNGLGGATGNVTVNTGGKCGTFGVRSIATPVTLNTGGTLHNQGGGVGTWTGNITLAGDNTAIDTNQQQITISGTVSESGGVRTLTKSNTGATLGTLVITGSLNHTGNTSITNGWLQLGSGGTTGTMNSNPIDLVSATSGFIINRSDDVTINNVITGSGPAANNSDPSALTKNGTGTLTLTGASTYSGATRLAAGTVAIGSNNTVFGTGLVDFRTAGLRSSDATPRTIANPLSYSSSTVFGSATTGNLLFTGTVATGGGAKTFTIDNAITEFSGVLSGTASTSTLTKAGLGTLILSNDNSYLQTLTITTGVVQVGNGGITGNLSTTAVINNASLVINRSLDVGVTEFTMVNAISGTGTLTHSGPATTVLSGANTYTGDTIVTNGIVRHPNANFADTASIQMSGTGKLDLTHVGTDTVLKLVINGTAQTVGIYGATGSGAQFETPFITGSGTLTVTSDGATTPYSSWATDKGLTGANNAAGADPDLDGVANLNEFALDSNPLSGATGGRFVVKVASVGGQQVLTLTLPVRTAVGAFTGATTLSATGDGVTYFIEGSDNVGAWNLDIDEVTGADATAIQSGLPALSGPGWTYRTFRSPGPVSSDSSDFMRVRVQ